MKNLLCFVLLSAVLATARANEPTAESILKFGGGDAVLTAKITKFPYTRSLRAAVQREDGGLKRLFRFTNSDSFMGSGAEDHCAVLRDLLRFWGDDEFARVLALESPKIRSAVIGALDYAWPDPGWKPNEFPLTYRLAKHDQDSRGRP